MDDSTFWWLIAGGAVAIELLTGTFYLLMVAIGLAAGAVAAHLGAGIATQLVAAAAIGSGAVAAWHLRRGGVPPAPASGNRDVNLDVGEMVQVERWEPDGTARVKYRGAQWTVTSATGQPEGTGAHLVREVVGSRLIVEKV
ncbi:MAG TPA: NfeD family protein [Ramlibacter sp.]|uniref:NfeD family protein n=1 Tax=Ramlibacter sp. TaxID=1917967 RepID=UPI002C39AB36|nr:NfeD family protein [Ramlibacter sp.]HVZ44976.1 NfeD family protein [Ramlibacter sp.]